MPSRTRGCPRGRPLVASSVLTALWLAGSGRLFATDWTQFDFDSLHSGSNPQETTIHAGNVASLHVMYSVALPAVAEAV